MAEFDQFSADYDDRLKQSLAGLGTVDSAISSKLAVIRKVLGREALSPVSRVLDFGCGTGLLSQYLGEFGDMVLGLDVSSDSLTNSLAEASARTCYSGHEIPFRDDTIDFAVASCVFHHIPPDQREFTTRELFRVLRPGGIFLIIEHNPWNPVTRWVVNRCEFDEDAILLKLKESRGLLKGAGFSAVSGKYFYAIPPVNGLLANLDSALGQAALGAQYFCHGMKPQTEQDSIRS